MCAGSAVARGGVLPQCAEPTQALIELQLDLPTHTAPALQPCLRASILLMFFHTLLACLLCTLLLTCKKEREALQPEGA